MKIFLTLLVLFFSSSAFAEDISDFQIEGMSIGDSLLDYFSEEEIIKNYKSHYYQYKKDKSFVAIEFNELKNIGDYEAIQIHIYNQIDNQKYIQNKNYNFNIVSIDGMIDFSNRINECYKKQIEVEKQLTLTFKNAIKRNAPITKHRADSSGKSTFKAIYFEYSNGDYAEATCFDWSTESNKIDHLRIGLATSDFKDWIKADN